MTEITNKENVNYFVWCGKTLVFQSLRRQFQSLMFQLEYVKKQHGGGPQWILCPPSSSSKGFALFVYYLYILLFYFILYVLNPFIWRLLATEKLDPAKDFIFLMFLNHLEYFCDSICEKKIDSSCATYVTLLLFLTKNLMVRIISKYFYEFTNQNCCDKKVMVHLKRKNRLYVK